MYGGKMQNSSHLASIGGGRSARRGRRRMGGRGVVLLTTIIGAIAVGRCGCGASSSSSTTITIARVRGGGGGSDDDPRGGGRGPPPPPPPRRGDGGRDGGGGGRGENRSDRRRWGRGGSTPPPPPPPRYSRVSAGDDAYPRSTRPTVAGGDDDEVRRRRRRREYGHRYHLDDGRRDFPDHPDGGAGAVDVVGQRDDRWDDDGIGRAQRGYAGGGASWNDRYDDGGGGVVISGGVPERPVPPPPPPRPPLPLGTDVGGGGATMSDSSSSSLSYSSSRAGRINPAETERVPIHYVFPTAEAAAEGRRRLVVGAEGENAADDDVPYLDVDEDEFFMGGDGNGRPRRRKRRTVDDDDGRYLGASPRRDAVTTFMSTRRGAMKVRVGSIVIGAAMGGFIGKSLLNDPLAMSMAMSSLLFVTGFLRNDYGELSRTLGLALVLTLQRASTVRREYPTLPHLKAMIRQGPRRPFPPVEDGGSPWRYEPTYRDDPEFKMTYALLAMSLVGSFCGGNVPILPAWMGGILGAVTFASLTTGSNARGDLGRSMGMRLVGLVRVAIAINSELRILGKAATVGGLLFDKVMIMDRKHRIKDKIVAICKWGYDKVSSTAEQVKEEMQDERPLRR
ncbi:hypothetical protein ACHAXA_005956 [Cyclostephanos tholiformis]|uniref:Uncharacterized protein n=1 Tax=Cyclostephanos tholiformis TaxID=382380 RepID=A0ABD3SEF8_9STRA